MYQLLLKLVRVMVLFAVVLLAFILLTATAIEWCVIPTDQSQCPCSHDCHTFDYYLNHSDTYFVSNTTFQFLSGVHQVHQSYIGAGVSNLTLTGKNATLNISIVKNPWFMLKNSESIYVSGLNFIIKDWDLLIIENVTNIEMKNTSIECIGECGMFFNDVIEGKIVLHQLIVSSSSAGDNSSMSMMIGINNFCGEIDITESYFHGNVELSCSFSPDTELLPLLTANTTININNSVFFLGYDPAIDSPMNIDIKFDGNNVPINASKVNIIITNCSILGSLFHGELIYINAFYTENLDITVVLDNVYVELGAIKAILIDFTTFKGVYHLIINECTFQHASGSAINIWLGNNPLSEVIIQNSIIKWNKGNVNGIEPVMAILNIPSHQKTASVIMSNVTVDSNIFSSSDVASMANRNTLLLYKLPNVTMMNCTFRNNTGTALYLDSSVLKIFGHNEFINNVGYEGAAMYINGGSLVKTDEKYKEKTTILFINNTASHTGGAIYISPESDISLLSYIYSSHTHQKCFFDPNILQLPPKRCTQTNDDCVFVFDNNTANDGGDDIYGGNLEESQSDFKKCIEIVELLSDFRQKSISHISSSPSRVCVCNNSIPDCLKYNLSVSIYPGQEFNISAFTVGQHFGTSRGSVYAQILNKSSNASIPYEDKVQPVGIRNCSSVTNILTYRIEMPLNGTIIVLTAGDQVVNEKVDNTKINKLIKKYIDNDGLFVPQELGTLAVYITLNVLPCPLGFTLDSSICKCAHVLSRYTDRYNVSCDIDTQTIKRQSSVWIDSSNETTKYSYKCPLTYCNQNTVSVNLSREHGVDSQCIHHHSGVLCGGCMKNYSLAIGSSNCLPHCSDDYLSFLLVFAVAGVLLVLLIKYLDLTITQGVMNGFIFYANIVQTNKDTLLFSDDPAVSVFATFIAWLNLDFGIETCFSQSLDMYTKTWLQFVFPLYLWVLAGGMILACRYSQGSLGIMLFRFWQLFFYSLIINFFE